MSEHSPENRNKKILNFNKENSRLEESQNIGIQILDSADNDKNLQGQERSRSPPSTSHQTQRENEERFARTQNEITTLKSLMKKLIEQNNGKTRQAESASTSSSHNIPSDNDLLLSYF